MKHTVTVSKKYQIIIPQKIRKALDISVGDKVIFSRYKNKIVIQKELSLKEKRDKWLKNALSLYAKDAQEKLWGQLEDGSFK